MLFSMLSCGSAFVPVPKVETMHGVNSRALVVRTTVQSSKAGTSAAGQGMSSARRKVPLTDEEYNHVARTVKVRPEQLKIFTSPRHTFRNQ